MAQDNQALFQLELDNGIFAPNQDYPSLQGYHIAPLPSAPSSASFAVFAQDYPQDHFGHAIGQPQQPIPEEPLLPTSPLSNANNQVEMPMLNFNDVPNPVHTTQSAKVVAPLASGSLNPSQRTGTPMIPAARDAAPQATEIAQRCRALGPGVERRFKCEKEGCGKDFKRRYNLKVHMRKHTGETPYFCPHPGCGRKYLWRSSMAHHLTVHSRKKRSQENVLAGTRGDERAIGRSPRREWVPIPKKEDVLQPTVHNRDPEQRHSLPTSPAYTTSPQLGYQPGPSLSTTDPQMMQFSEHHFQFYQHELPDHNQSSQ